MECLKAIFILVERVTFIKMALPGSSVFSCSLWQHSNERGVWNPNFPMPLSDWEIVIVECFLARLQDKVVVEGREECDKVLGGNKEWNLLY